MGLTPRIIILGKGVSLLLTLSEEGALWLSPLRKQFAKVRAEFFNSGNQAVIRLITPLRMSHEESYAKAFPFDKMIPGMLDPEM